MCLSMALAAPVVAEAYEVVGKPVEDLSHVIRRPRMDEENPEILELFAGEARLTRAFAAKGKTVTEPRDLRYGHDIRNQRVRQEILNDIESLCGWHRRVRCGARGQESTTVEGGRNYADFGRMRRFSWTSQQSAPDDRLLEAGLSSWRTRTRVRFGEQTRW